jgi:hypothetical protein
LVALHPLQSRNSARSRESSISSRTVSPTLRRSVVLHRERCNRKSNAALFGLRRLIEGLSARWALFSLPPPDDEASFVTDVSLTPDERAEAALLADVVCDDDRAALRGGACRTRARTRRW